MTWQGKHARVAVRAGFSTWPRCRLPVCLPSHEEIRRIYLSASNGVSCGVAEDTDWSADDQILVQLGDARHFEGQERRDYIKGLCAVLGDLKTRQIKDFDATAQSIIDFRAKFRKDPYRILPLGDVSI